MEFLDTYKSYRERIIQLLDIIIIVFLRTQCVESTHFNQIWKIYAPVRRKKSLPIFVYKFSFNEFFTSFTLKDILYTLLNYFDGRIFSPKHCTIISMRRFFLQSSLQTYRCVDFFCKKKNPRKIQTKIKKSTHQQKMKKKKSMDITHILCEFQTSEISMRTKFRFMAIVENLL